MGEIRQKLRTGLLALGVLGALLGPRLGWRLKPARKLDVVIVDKTVPFEKYREHVGFSWILHALKIECPGGGFLDPARDYVGFNPRTRRGNDLTAEDLEHADVLFVADTYGVYAGDYERPGDEAALERSPRIYGGFDDKEAQAIEAFAARSKLVVAEFNTFASPTTPEARERLERVFGVRWTKWVARYWPNLQDENEVPRWVGRVWQNVTHTPFDLKGGGLVFVREDEDIVVLLDGEDLTGSVVTQERTPRGESLGLPGRGGFWFWMDLVEATDAEVLYEHAVGTTPAGDKKLAQHHLRPRFPALTKHKDAWYFAGDFVDTAVDLGNPETFGLLPWREHTSGCGGGSTQNDGCFWGFYAPIIEKILGPRTH